MDNLTFAVSNSQAILSGSNFKFTIEKKSMQEFASQLSARDLKSYMDDFDSLIKGENICFDLGLNDENISFEMENGKLTIFSLPHMEFFFEYNGNRQIIFELMQFLLEIFAEKLLELTKKRKLWDMK